MRVCKSLNYLQEGVEDFMKGWMGRVWESERGVPFRKKDWDFSVSGIWGLEWVVCSFLHPHPQLFTFCSFPLC